MLQKVKCKGNTFHFELWNWVASDAVTDANNMAVTKQTDRMTLEKKSK